MLQSHLIAETPPLRRCDRHRRIALFLGSVAAVALTLPAQAGTVTITGNAATDTTNLNAEIAAANASGTPFTITIAASGANTTINLNANITHLTPTANVTIVGTGGATIDGGGARMLFAVDSGTVAFQDLALANGIARGGNGGNSSAGGGGGGVGAGSALFVNSAATVTVQDVAFTSNTSEGGNGGTTVAALNNGGGGGGGLNGGTGSNNAGTTGGNGGSGSGFPGSGGSGAAAAGTGGNGATGGGGGGGGGSPAGTGGNGGNGGFGGGGGGGGGGSVAHGTGGTGGGGGGDGSSTGGVNGQAGTGFGGAIFVMDGGSLTIIATTDLAFSGNAANQGTTGQTAKQNLGNDIFISDLGGAQNTVTFQVDSGTAALAGSTSTSTVGSIAGEGGIAKTGAGMLVLSGTNTYTGATTVNAGTLEGGAANVFIATSATTVNTGGTLDLGGFAQTVNAVSLAGGTISNGTLTGAITSTGGAVNGIAGAATLTTTSGTTVAFGTNSYTGATTVSGGILLGGATNAFSEASAMTVTGAGILDINGLDQQIASLAGNGMVTNADGGPATLTTGDATSTTFSGTIQDGTSAIGLTKVGTGTFTLSGANTYTGATTVTAGTLLGGAANAFSASSATTVTTGGTLDLGGFAQTINAVALADGTIRNGSLTGAITSADGTVDGIGGSATLTTTGSTTTLLGTNAYTGATAVNAGTLLGGAANVFSAASATTVNTGGTVDLGGFAQTINAVALAGGTITNGSLTGAITSTGGTVDGIGGSATLTTTSSITTVLGANTYTGATTVNGGTLQVDGTITGTSGVAVNSGGTLTGTGTVGSATVAINNGATFAPGNGTPGSSFNVTGDLALQSGAFYAVQINPATASFADITGSAALGGATVNATYAAGTYVAKQYLILQTTAGVTGTFGVAVNTNLPSGFTATLAYDANNAFLDLALAFSPPPGSGLDPNQQSVANALVNAFNSNGGIPLVFGGLTGPGLTQLSGEGGHGAVQTTAYNATNLFIGTLLDPAIDGRGDDTVIGGATALADDGGEPLAYAGKRKASRSERDAYAAVTPRATSGAPWADSFAARWSIWASGYGGSSRVDGNAAGGSHATTSSIFGTAVGADVRINRDTLVGFAVGGAGSSFSTAVGLGGGRADLFQAGIYGRHTFGAAYVAGALAYGWQDVSTDRIVTVAGPDHLRAEFHTSTFAARGETGYRFATALVGVTPYAAVQATTFHLPSYAESAVSGSNQFALAFASQTATNIRTELGVRTDRSFAVGDGVLTLRGRAAWAHDSNTSRIISPTFQSLLNSSFTINGAEPAPDGALVSAGAEMKWRNGWSLAGRFEGEFSRTTESYAGKGIVRYAW